MPEAAVVAVVKVERICSTNRLQVAARHNLREIVAEIGAHGDIDAKRTHLNHVLVGPKTAQGIMDLHRQLLDSAQPTPVRKDGSRAKLRHDAVLALELVVSAPPGAVDEAMFFDDALAWVDQRFGVPVLSAVWHRDQSKEHVHCLLLPLKNGRMVGSCLAGRYDRMLDDFHDKVGQKYGLARKVRLNARSRKIGASLAIGELNANPARLLEPAVNAILQAYIERDPGPMLQALGLIVERPSEKKWIETMTRPVTAEKPIVFDGHGPAVAPAGHQVDDRTLSCVRFRHDPLLVDAHAAPAAGVADPDDHAALVVAQPDHHDDAHALLAGEAWLVLPTWQLASTAYASPAPQPTAPVRIMLDDIGQLADDGGDDDDDGLIRVHEDQVPSSQWHDGQPMLLPPKPPSRRAQMEAAVQRALTNLTN